MSQASISLIRIPTKDIFIDNDPEIDVIKILVLSNKYSERSESLNYIPITVVPERGGNYRLVKGHEIYYALVQAGKEWALALRITEDESSDNYWMYELGLSKPQLNICTLDPIEFESAFEYMQTNIKAFSKLKLEKLVQCFATDPTRKFWSSLDILIDAKCGITKTNLPLLAKFLCALPDLSELKPISSICINRCSEEDLVEQLQRLKIEVNAGKLRKIDSVSTARSIIADKDRVYWSLSKHMTRARNGITAALWPLVENGFFFDPAPAPDPNTSRFLLGQLSVIELRKEAKRRNLETKGLLKADLLRLLSSD